MKQKNRLDLDRRYTDKVWDDRFPSVTASPQVSGSGVANQVAYWDSTVVLTGDAAFTLDTADDFYVIADGGGIRNNSSTVGLILSANGSIQLDNAGNARGTESIDLQNTRIAATGVVSGDYSFAACSSNIVSGDYAAAFGYYNEISANYGLITGSESVVSANYAVALGELCTSSGTYSYTHGQSCQAIGTRAHAEGTACVATGDYSWATGRNAKTGAYSGAWIWADSTNADFNGIIADEFAIRARGGYRHAYSDTYYMSRAVASDGDTTFDITAAAGTPVFNFSKTVNVPDLVSSSTVTVPNTGLHLLDTNASHDLIIAPGSDLTADRTFTITTGDADRTLTLGANVTLNQDLQTIDSPSFVGVTLGNTGLHVLDTDASHDLIIKPGSNLTADRTLNVTTGDADRTLTLSGNLTVSSSVTLNQDLTTTSSVVFARVQVNASDGFKIADTSEDDHLTLQCAEMTADHALTFNVNDGDRTLTLTTSAALNQDLETTDSPTFANVNVPDGGAFRNSGGASLIMDSSGATDFAHFSGCDVGIGRAPTTDLDVYRSGSAAQVKIETATSGIASLSIIDSSGGAILLRGDSGASYINTTGRFGVGIAASLAKCHVDQSSTTATIPVLYLDQADISEEAIYFVGESSASTANQTLVDASDFTTPGAITAWLKVVVSDQRAGGLGTIDGWIPIYAIPTA